MNLEKLGMGLFLKSLKDQDQIKSHLKSSAKNLLLASLQSLEILGEATLESEILKPYQKAHLTVQQFDLLNKDLIKRLSKKSPQDLEKTKILRQTVSEILDEVNQEKTRLRNSKQKDKNEKIKGLDAITDVLNDRFLKKNDASSKNQSASKK